MKHTVKNEITKNYTTKLASAILILVIAFIGIQVPYKTHAAGGDAYFSLSPASGSYTVGNNLVLTVSETSTSGDNTNAAQVNLSYPSSLHFQSITLSGPFTLCGQQTGGSGSVNIGCASTTVVSGTQQIAQITFSVLTNGTAPVTMTSGSDIDNTGGTSVWNGVLASASFTLAQPVTTTAPPSTTTGSSGGTKSSGSSSSSSTTTKTTTTTPTTTSTITPLAAAAAPSKGSISVTIVNAQGKTIAGAKVTLSNQQSAVTNAYGVANFSGVTSGNYTVTVTQPGKKSTQTKFSLTPGEDKLVSLKLANTSSSKSYTALLLVGLIVIILLLGGGIGLRISRRKLNTPPYVDQNNTPPVIMGETAVAPTVVAPIVSPIPTNVLPQPPLAPTTPAPYTAQDPVVIQPTAPHNP